MVIPEQVVSSRCFRPQLYAVPVLDLVAEHLVDQPVLLDHGQALEPVRRDGDGVHAAAPAADVFDLQAPGGSHVSLHTPHGV